MSKQIDFLKRCIALNLQSGGLLDLLDRIEELERKVASCDAEVVSLTNQRDYEYVRAENAEQERDQLRKDVTLLRDAVKFWMLAEGNYDLMKAYKKFQEALAATEPK